MSRSVKPGYLGSSPSLSATPFGIRLASLPRYDNFPKILETQMVSRLSTMVISRTTNYYSNMDGHLMTISSFQGEHSWLSNFWPVQVEYEGIIFPSVEHAYQAAKTLDMNKRKEMALLSRPGEAKRVGKGLTFRSDWNQIKVEIMTELVEKKFKDPILRQKLKSTGDQPLIEGNTWHDTFWGVCNGKGQNHLGKILMKVRENL